MITYAMILESVPPSGDEVINIDTVGSAASIGNVECKNKNVHWDEGTEQLGSLGGDINVLGCV